MRQLWDLSFLFESKPEGSGKARTDSHVNFPPSKTNASAPAGATIKCSEAREDCTESMEKQAARSRIACLKIPGFPLQLFFRRHPEWRGHPIAIVDEDKPQGRILCLDETARRAGLLLGESYGSALSLVPGLRGKTFPAKEMEKATRELLDTLECFSPTVEAVPGEPGAFWLDATGLQPLLRSLEVWVVGLERSLRKLALKAFIVVGFSRFATYAIASFQGQTSILSNPEQEQQEALQAPLHLLGIDPAALGELQKLGVETIKELLKLPATGLQERYGQRVQELRRLASPREWIPLQPTLRPKPLQESECFEDPESNAIRLSFAIKRLLHPMLAKLAEQGLAARELLLDLELAEGGSKQERLLPAVPTLDSILLIELVRLRLERLQLASGVICLNLAVLEAKASSEQLQLFQQQPRRDLGSAEQALARVRSILGEDRVVVARICQRHLPEAKFTWEPLLKLQIPRPRVTGFPPLIRRIFVSPKPLTYNATKGGSRPAPPFPPPGFSTLRPFPEAHIRGPYLVSGGWWHREVRRTYYFIKTDQGEWLWIFYDEARQEWFLQGRVE